MKPKYKICQKVVYLKKSQSGFEKYEGKVARVQGISEENGVYYYTIDFCDYRMDDHRRLENVTESNLMPTYKYFKN